MESSACRRFVAAPAFHRKSILPVLFVILAIPALLNYRYPLESHGADIVLEACCMIVALLGLTIRALTVGFRSGKASLENTALKNTVEKFSTKGMYSLVRHPLCLGNFFLGLAPVLFLHTWWLFVLYVLFFALYCKDTLKREDERLAAKWGKFYQNWAETTPALIPSTLRWTRPDRSFSWKTAFRQEYGHFFVLVAVMALLEHLGDFVISHAFAIDAAWTSIFLLSAGICLVVYSAYWAVCTIIAIVSAFPSAMKEASGQQVTSPLPYQGFTANSGSSGVPPAYGYVPPQINPVYISPQFQAVPNHSSPPGFSAPSYNPPPINETSPSLACSPYASGLQPVPSTGKLFLNDPNETASTSTRLGSMFKIAENTKRRLFSDYKNLYNCNNAMNFGIATMGAAVLANTQMDCHFQRWYYKQTQCWTTDKFSEFSKVFGEGKYFIPITVTSALAYRYWQERTGNQANRRPAGDFFARSARGYAVGAPTLLVGQLLLGGDRPRDGSSYWQPFQQNHGISGHAFIGAIPFITAAHMTDRIWAKGVFYTLSILPAWSRVNDDAHYLSQVVLGWYLAYLSVRAVSETEGLKPLPKGLTFFPVLESNGGVGFGLIYRR